MGPEAAWRTYIIPLTPKQGHLDAFKEKVDSNHGLLPVAWDMSDEELHQALEPWLLMTERTHLAWLVALITGMSDVADAFPPALARAFHKQDVNLEPAFSHDTVHITARKPFMDLLQQHAGFLAVRLLTIGMLRRLSGSRQVCPIRAFFSSSLFRSRCLVPSSLA